MPKILCWLFCVVERTGAECSLPKEVSSWREERTERGLWYEDGGIVVTVTMCWVERWDCREFMSGVKSLRAVWYC